MENRCGPPLSHPQVRESDLDIQSSSQEELPGGEATLILLCTYNEAGNLPRMFELLEQHVPQADILVVDDNSPDGTGEIVQQYSRENPRIQLLARPGKQGLGTATRDGIHWGLSRDYQFLVNLDADHSHDPGSIPGLLAACQSVSPSGKEYDVAIGSRYVDGGGFEGLPWHRRIISQALNGYATRMLRLPIRDCSGSFRCYRTATLR